MRDKLALNDVIKKMKENETNYVEFYGSGEYIKKTFSEVYVDVMRIVAYLRSKEIARGRRIGIIGINSYEYMILDLATIIGGYVSVPFPEKDFSGKVGSLKEQFDLATIFADEKYVSNGEIENLAQLMKYAEHLTYDDVVIVPREPEEYFTIIFTSGTTGLPKGIEVRVKCVEDWMINLVNSFDFHEDDKLIDFFTLSISNARLFVYASILIQFSLTLTNTNQLLRVLALAKPTIMQGVPYLFETFYNSYYSIIKQSMKKRISFSLYPVLSGILPRKIAKKWNQNLFSSLRNMLGGNMRILVTGSAPTSKNILKIYEQAGLRIYEAYGINEVGLVSLNNEHDYRRGSVGKPYPSKEILISKEHEILIKSEYNWGTHYINDVRNAAAQTFTKDGYVATGDIGYLDEDGFLYIQGRLKEVLVLSNGDKIHPGVIEEDLKQTRLVKQAVAIGNQRPFIVCVIVLEDPKLPIGKIKDAIHEINKGYANSFKIKDFIIANSPFTVENGLMNSTLKINRNAVYKKYEVKIENLYK